MRYRIVRTNAGLLAMIEWRERGTAERHLTTAWSPDQAGIWAAIRRALVDVLPTLVKPV